jgi:hypothetical protein
VAVNGGPDAATTARNNVALGAMVALAFTVMLIQVQAVSPGTA